MKIEKVKVGIKLLDEKAVLPKKAHASDGAFDIVATSRTLQGDMYVYGTGFALEIPYGYVGLIFPRSGIGNTRLSIANCVGFVDSGFRGEVKVKYNKLARYPVLYEVGDRIAQIFIVKHPEVEFVLKDTLSESDRGEGGFGSTGKK